MDIIPQVAVNSIIAGSIYALVAFGFNLIFSTTKFFNLSHGIVIVFGGYIVFFLSRNLELNLGISIPLGIIAAGGLGFLLEKIIFLPLRKKKSSNMILLVASLGAFAVIQAVISILFTNQFTSLSSGNISKTYSAYSAFFTETQIFLVITTILILVFLSVALEKTFLGKAYKAISDDEEVAKIVGINTDKIIGYVFFIGSALAGITGIFMGFDTGLEPSMGLPLLLKGIIASIVGGLGNIYGGFLGAFVLGFAENFGIIKISSEWKDAIAFTILILFLIFRPKGIINK